MSRSAGRMRASRAYRSVAGSSMRSVPSRWRRSKKKAVSGTSARCRATSIWLPARPAVTWNGLGRPSGRSATASPSRTAARASSASAASAISGTRAVMSSRVRVNTATPESSRWTWTRIPSIFHSTAADETRAKAAATLLADEASIGHSGQGSAQQVRPPDLAGRYPGGAGDRLDHHPFQRALVQFPRDQPGEEVALGRGGPAEQTGQQAPARRLGAGPGDRAHLGERGVYLTHGEGRHCLFGRAVPGEQPAKGRVAHADLALEQLAGEEGDDNRHFLRAGRAEQARDLLDLDAAPWGRGHGLRGQHQLGQQHNRIVPERADG